MNITELAKQAGFLLHSEPPKPFQEALANFAALVIEAHTKELLAGVVEPCDYQYVFEYLQKEPFYSADQLAAAVLRERERCAQKCESARETIWEYHPAEVKAAACNVCTNLAAAIRGSANRSADSAESFCNDEMEAHDQNWKHGEEA